MSSLDSLPGDQRAVLELVLRQGRGYEEIERLLSIDRTAVRARALAALDALGPPTALQAERRALIADYLLGQLPPRVADEVGERLADHPEERAWADALHDELTPFASRPLAAVPGRATAPARPTSRRGGAILLGGGVLAAIVAAVLLLALGGGHRKPPPRAPTRTTAHTTTTPQPRVLAQINLLPPGGKGAAKGIAELIAEDGKLAVLIVASGLTPNTKHNIYAVWLYRSPSQSVRVGFVTPGVGSDGRVERLGLLPSDAASYKELLMTLEPEPPPTTPGIVVLAGAIKIPQ